MIGLFMSSITTTRTIKVSAQTIMELVEKWADIDIPEDASFCFYEMDSQHCDAACAIALKVEWSE
jgi:hypothetical protein